MSSKEKAIELIEKFKINDYDWIAQGNLYSVKQHALIVVGEIIELFGYVDENHQSAWNKIGHIEYWKEVKKEIEKL